MRVKTATKTSLNRWLTAMPLILFAFFAAYVISQAHGYNPDTEGFGNECSRNGYCDQFHVVSP